MATYALPPRRVLYTAGFALAVGVALPAWALGGFTAGPTAHSLADPASCQVSSATASAQITCAPGDPSGNSGGMASEQQLTQQNSGNNAGGGANAGSHH
jgi:hypothetical protein